MFEFPKSQIQDVEENIFGGLVSEAPQITDTFTGILLTLQHYFRYTCMYSSSIASTVYLLKRNC